MKPSIATRSLVAVLAATVMLAGCFDSAYYSGTDYSCSGSSQRVVGLLTVNLMLAHWRVYEDSGVIFSTGWTTAQQLESSTITFSGETHGTWVRIESDTGERRRCRRRFRTTATDER